MFERIVLATDLSPVSDVIIDSMEHLKAFGVRDVVLAHVVYVRLHYPDTGGIEEALMQVATPKLEAQRQRIEAAGLTVKTVMTVGVPHVEIDRLAEGEDADLIVVGSHGEGLLRGSLLGSVTSELIQHARKPILVVRTRVPEANSDRPCEVACGAPCARLLYPTDFSDTAEQAFAYVEKMVSSGCLYVDLLHVQDQTRLGTHLINRLDEFNTIDLARLRRLEDRLRALGAIEVTINISYGSPTSIILERVRSGNCSLVVMGTQGRGFIEEIFLGSVSHNVVRHATIPVLLIPPKR